MKAAVCSADLVITETGSTCSGSWVAVDVTTSMAAFDPSTLSPAILVEAFGAGLTVQGALLVTILVLRQILKLLK